MSRAGVAPTSQSASLATPFAESSRFMIATPMPTEGHALRPRFTHREHHAAASEEGGETCAGTHCLNRKIILSELSRPTGARLVASYAPEETWSVRQAPSGPYQVGASAPLNLKKSEGRPMPDTLSSFQRPTSARHRQHWPTQNAGRYSRLPSRHVFRARHSCVARVRDRGLDRLRRALVRMSSGGPR